METIESINKEIVALQKKIHDLEQKKIILKSDPIGNSESGQLAIKLHGILCRCNHIDDCSWYYDIQKNGIPNWNGHAHKKYLKQASDILDTFGRDKVQAYLDILQFKSP